MNLWGELLGWGYGYFNCNAGEHLNKQIKSLEFDSTNLKDNRFIQVCRSFRLRQFIYPEKITPPSCDVTCSACHLKGHNKKNKLCRLHPDSYGVLRRTTLPRVNSNNMIITNTVSHSIH